MHVTCVDWTDVLGAGRAAAAPRPASCSSRSTATAIDLVWHERGYPSHGDYRDSHRLTARAHAAWANDGTPYDPERGAARARAARRATSSPRSTAPVVAFDTELFGHHWHEGVTFLAAVLEQADVVPLDARATPRAAPDAPPTSWGEARDLRTWSAPAAGGSRGRSAAPSSRRSARARRRARCASCSRCRAPTGRS